MRLPKVRHEVEPCLIHRRLPHPLAQVAPKDGLFTHDKEADVYLLFLRVHILCELSDLTKVLYRVVYVVDRMANVV